MAYFTKAPSKPGIVLAKFGDCGDPSVSPTIGSVWVPSEEIELEGDSQNARLYSVANFMVHYYDVPDVLSFYPQAQKILDAYDLVKDLSFYLKVKDIGVMFAALVDVESPADIQHDTRALVRVIDKYHKRNPDKGV